MCQNRGQGDEEAVLTDWLVQKMCLCSGITAQAGRVEHGCSETVSMYLILLFQRNDKQLCPWDWEANVELR